MARRFMDCGVSKWKGLIQKISSYSSRPKMKIVRAVNLILPDSDATNVEKRLMQISYLQLFCNRKTPRLLLAKAKKLLSFRHQRHLNAPYQKLSDAQNELEDAVGI
ncbi:hypothetical protein RF11_00783 [Thelohanellus kitauei]|uniref:Uncharacterized protein n=1 Tax=Thelohanellus kitauei TaxID=669202 RepID=A0A0C2J2A5_THEKT|nr:hypothetical protein RF11_00783 [Thelohanellus kitauei]